jgi:hypothetical protein
MKKVNFKRAVCQQYGIEEQQYASFVLARSLFKRVRFFSPLIQLFNPHYLFNERRLVEKVAKANSLREIQAEVDFYQHKYVVNFLWKDTLRFRLSGMRLMSLGNEAFMAKKKSDCPISSPQESAKS